MPSLAANPDNFSIYYGLAQKAIAAKKPLVQSEGGAAMQTGGGYAQDGRSQARYMLMQVLDHYRKGGHRFMIYNLFDGQTGDNNAEDNFGIYKSDQVTQKPSAIALHNMSNLLSLNNNWQDPLNDTDTHPFVPAYVGGSGFSVSGLGNPGASGSSLIMPKSDGSTMIAVWNEPKIEDFSGTSFSPAANSVTVNLGSSHKYRVFDPTGGGNVADFTASTSLAPIAWGFGPSVSLTLYGTPLFIELLPN